MSKIKTVLYFFAAIFLVYAIFCTYSSIEYINSLISAGTITFSSAWADVIQYVGTASFAFYFYAIVLCALAYIIKLVEGKKEVEKELYEPVEGEMLLSDLNHYEDIDDLNFNDEDYEEESDSSGDEDNNVYFDGVDD